LPLSTSSSKERTWASQGTLTEVELQILLEPAGSQEALLTIAYLQLKFSPLHEKKEKERKKRKIV
jgi:hypothetical protein